MRVLIIEDDVKTANYLRKGLSEHDFVVDVADTGDDGVQLALMTTYDVIVLDVMLPGKDGWAVIRALRSEDNATPIIFVTARDAVEDRVKGLELGGDDYLVKPFAFSELLARIRALVRRGTTPQVAATRIADLDIDVLRHRATRAGQRLDLSPKEFALLTVLARRSGEVMSRTLLAEQVWDINFDSDTNVVDVAIRRLRRKVDDPFDKKLIHTVRGVGYVLEER